MIPDSRVSLPQRGSTTVSLETKPYQIKCHYLGLKALKYVVGIKNPTGFSPGISIAVETTSLAIAYFSCSFRA